MKVDLEQIKVTLEPCPVCEGQGAFYSTDPFNISRDEVTECGACMGTKKLLRVHDFPYTPENVELYLMTGHKGDAAPLHQILFISEDSRMIVPSFNMERELISRSLIESMPQDWPETLAKTFPHDGIFYQVSQDKQTVKMDDGMNVTRYSIWSLLNTEAAKLQGFYEEPYDWPIDELED